MCKVKIIKGLAFFSSLFFLLLAGSTILFSLIVKEKNSHTLASPLVQGINDHNQNTNSLFATGLDKEVKRELDSLTGSYSFIVINLATGESYRHNPDRIYYSASLYKLWLMVVVYDQIEKGNLTLEAKLSSTVPKLNDEFNIASEEAELSEGDIEYTVKQALEKAITVSDNYAALLLTETVGISKLKEFLNLQGLLSSKVGSPPKTTAEDMSTFFLKLYRKELVNEGSSNEMLSLLKRQVINDRIPKYLPTKVKVAHKTGELYGYKHDVGIVFNNTGDYIFIGMSETKDPAEAAEAIARISEITYQYFTTYDSN